MEIIIALLLVIVIYLVITTRSETGNQFEELNERLTNLQSLIDTLRKENSAKKIQTDQEPRPAPRPFDRPVVPPPVVITTPVPEPKIPEPVPETPVTPPIVELQPEVIRDPLASIRKPVKTFDTSRPKTEIPPKPGFFERNPDLEKFIGENLISKIGIAIVVLGIAYFVKYAIDVNWIGPWGRVAIGILCGAILIGLAHWFRNTYKAFSSVLAGGGLAVFYFTITLAFHQFNLLSQTTSFIILIGVTIFAVLLSLLYDKQELAVIALVGGLSSPFMLSTGHANYNALFIYLAILNGGLLVLAYYKAWRILNISTFILTVLVFGGVMYTLTNGTYHVGLLYASIFYLLFFAINIANNLREGKKFIASDFGILLANTALYFAAGLYLLTMMHAETYRGLFCAVLAAVNLVLSFLLFRNKRVDTNVLYLLIGITLTFISLTAPIQLHGHNITLFWASEAVLLYWLFQRSGIVMMKITSLIIWSVTLLSLAMDWMELYSNSGETLTIIANKGFITTFYAAISTYVLYLLMKKDPEEAAERWPALNNSIVQMIALVLLFLSGLLEVNHQFLTRYPETNLNILYDLLYLTLYLVLFDAVARSLKNFHYPYAFRTGFFAAAIVIYLSYNGYFFDIQSTMLQMGKPPLGHFFVHWLSALLIMVLFYNLIGVIRKHYAATMSPIIVWVLCAVIVLFLSLEVCLVSNHLFYSTGVSIDRLETVYVKTGLPVLWGLSSFAMMWLGMHYKERVLRIISLSLFSLTLLKLFIYDIRDIAPAGKIVAFICLGILLLVVSFMYQKVKKIITADENEITD